MGPNNVIEGGESENRGPGVQMCVVYTVVNAVLENSKIVKKASKWVKFGIKRFVSMR